MRLRPAGLSLLFILGAPELARLDAGSEARDHCPDEGRLEDLPNVHV